jgi:RNA polymerase sigma-54 factor
MTLSLSTSLTQSQQMRMSAAQTQALKLLQTSYVDLRAQVQQLLCDNLFLELDASKVDSEGQFDVQKPDLDTLDSVAMDTELELDSWRGEDEDSAFGQLGYTRAGLDGMTNARHPITLQEHLREQIAFMRLNPDERAALEDCIDSLDEDGYLRDAQWQVAALPPPWHRSEIEMKSDEEDLKEDSEEAIDEERDQRRYILYLVQSLEPAGVGARDLSECLVLQLQRLHEKARHANYKDEREAVEIAMRVCQTNLQALAQRRWNALSRELGADVSQIEGALHLIRSLHPRPGQKFTPVRPALRVAELEVYAEETPPFWRVRSLNPVRLRLHEARMTQWRCKEQIQEARWWCRALRQREATLLLIGQAIAELQSDFFSYGPSDLKPLTLAHIAERIGMHESTVSRAIVDKYLRCPWGLFALRYFFSSALTKIPQKASGSIAQNQLVSSHHVREMIQKMVTTENPHKPLSDQKIADKLAQQGIQCARRTVAKYREAMGVLPAAMRKVLD